MASNVWKRKVQQKNNKEDENKDFFVFGYSCKLFRDDEAAFFIDQGKHLIPWMGDESLLIDRYDGRGHLSDLRPYDTDKLRYPIEKTAQEKALEEQLERERYLELTVDIDEEKTREEEEWKRYYEAVNGSDFNAVGFSYDSNIEYDPSDPTETEVIEEPSLIEPYAPPEDLPLPHDLITPTSMKHHTIIQKTAKCIAEHGPQMEIMIKAKQTTNPQFDFLHYDHQLYSYYRHLVHVIKSGFYKPKPDIAETEQKEGSDEEQDDEDSHEDTYLHPSLMPVKKPEINIAAPVISIEGTSYGNLVQNLKDKIPKPLIPKAVAKLKSPVRESTPDSSQSDDATPVPTPADTPRDSPPSSPASETRSRSRSNTPVEKSKKKIKKATKEDKKTSENLIYGPMVVPPPPDLQPIIERMAQYVVKNGKDFEDVVKSKNDKRFTFILHGDVYNSYYELKKNFFLEEKVKYEEEQKLAATRSISFSLKAKPKEVETVKETGLTFQDDTTDEEENDDSKPKTTTTETTVTTQTTTTTQASNATKTSTISQTKTTTSSSISDTKKHAEDKVRDRLSAAARHKNATLTKDKQLQSDRKKRAAMFVNMLKSTTTVPPVESSIISDVPTASMTPLTLSASPSPLRETHSRSRSPQLFDYDHRLGAPKRSVTIPTAYKANRPPSTVKSPPVRDKPATKSHKKRDKSKRSRSKSPSTKKSKKDKKKKTKHKTKKRTRRSSASSESDTASKSSKTKHTKTAEPEPTSRPPDINGQSAISELTYVESEENIFQDTRVPMSDVQICQFRAMVKARHQAFWDDKNTDPGT